MFLELKRHKASLGWIERLHALRTGGVQPVQGKALAVVEELARQPQNPRADFGNMDQ
jgi:hypothetical protein